jgi:triacylglycerol lipase
MASRLRTMKPQALLLVGIVGALVPSCAPVPMENGIPVSRGAIIPEPRARVVFVHGIFQHGGVSFGTLRHRLESQGIACYAPTLTPRDARNGLVDQAHQLKQGIDREFGPRERITLVGFSLGGLVARYYLQELGGASRCDALYTVATPHQGTQAAWLYFGQGSRDLLPRSDFLKNLDKTADRLGDMPLVSYRSPYDLAILPTNHAEWDRAENHTAPVLIHPMLTRSPRVIDDLERRIVNAIESKAPRTKRSR